MTHRLRAVQTLPVSIVRAHSRWSERGGAFCRTPHAARRAWALNQASSRFRGARSQGTGGPARVFFYLLASHSCTVVQSHGHPRHPTVHLSELSEEPSQSEEPVRSQKSGEAKARLKCRPQVYPVYITLFRVRVNVACLCIRVQSHQRRSIEFAAGRPPNRRREIPRGSVSQVCACTVLP